MQSKVKEYIEKHHLLPTGAKVVVGLSGGADSVTLLFILRALGYACEAAHCNFHLRGEESDRDEQFVTTLCANWHIPLHKTNFDTVAYAKEHGLSVEMAARDLRYAWFETIRTATGAEAIAVAHHQNDQAETLLLNLKRGTGLRGLGGMRPKNGHIVRPLLSTTRREIELFCQQESLEYVTDSTNADTSIRRNAIRALLTDAEDSEIRHMADTAEQMQAYRLLLDALLLGTAIPEEANQTLLYELLAPYGFNASQAKDMLQALATSGKRFETNEYVATIDHGTLTVQPHAEVKDEAVPIVVRNVRPRLAKEFYPAADGPFAAFDADKLPQKLTLRHWQPGDYFYPITSGKQQKKKLQDFFSDQKMSIAEKNDTWLLADGDTIIWVVGRRIDNRFKITPATTHVAEICIELD